MKRLIFLLIFLLLFVGCTSDPAPVVDTSSTLVASTIAAWETSIAIPQTQLQTPNDFPSFTPTLAISTTALVEATPTYEPGYCNTIWARLVISQMKEIDEPSEGEDDSNFTSQNENTALTEELKLLIVAAVDIRIAKLASLPVPPCLERAKDLKLLTYETIKQLYSGTIPENEVWNSLITVGSANEEADAEIAKIEACLETGCD